MKTVFFDLDGTLTESGTGITRSAAYALRKFGIEETDQKKLDRFVGPPLIESFTRFYGFDMEKTMEAVGYFREYFSTIGIFENAVYDGVEEMLQTLCDHGIRCVIATSKPEQFAVQVLEHFGLERYFSAVAGATMDESRTDKADVIAYALEKTGLTSRDDIVMVGDREHDIIGARKNNLPAIGVLYGYGSREELEQAGAVAIAETPMDLPGLLL